MDNHKKGEFSLGTPMEIQHAAYSLHRPIYVITQDKCVKEHPWIMTHSTKIFKYKEEFEKWIVQTH